MLRTTTCLILLAFGCAAEPTLGTTQQGIFFDSVPPGDECEPWGCGSNSPIMAAFRFWDLPEQAAGSAVTNAQGFRITSFRKSGAAYRADVINDKLVGRSTLWPFGIQLDTAGEITGSIFYIDNVETGERFEMYVMEVGRVALFVHPQGRNIMTNTYRFQWRQVYPRVTHLEDLCGDSVDPDGITPFHAVVFADDQIDTAAIRYVGTRGNWFNIGCKGHTLAKQHLLGHTNAAAALIGNGWMTDAAARTANLKMLTADYCGTGNPFTIAGEALLWHDQNNAYDTLSTNFPGGLPAGVHVEARWSANGATCLNVPRVDIHHPNGVPEFNTDATHVHVEDWLTAPWCSSRPPPCPDDLTNFSGIEIISVAQ